jgi:hypothetical protein
LIESYRFVVFGEVGVGERTIRGGENDFTVADFAIFTFDGPLLAA